jgi:hypothetical protein
MIELLIITVLAFFVGWKASEFWMLITFKTLLEDLKVSESDLRKVAREKGITLPERIDSRSEPQLAELEVRLEKIGDQIFAYSIKDDQFLGQGTDRDSLVQRLTENLTNVRVIIAKEHGADLIYTKP